MNLPKTIVPTSTGDGQGELIYHDGKLQRYEHGSEVNVYLFHETDDEGNVRAFEITMPFPMTRPKCINAAEMAAYGLESAMDVASFTASLARKARLGEDPEEVAEHDQFIQDVKEELTRLGI